ncbi:MAG: ATP-binding cassette domain-containing protein [Austwickia sp.]|nr:MAG: ATP-binding cassette domain-containing protein [Austwickia sp.]
MEVAQLVGAGRSWQLEAGRSYRVGRDPSCEICIPHDEVSRVHAEVFLDPAGGWTIRDGRSLNGLYVAGRRVSDAPLEGPTVVTLSPSPHAPSLRVHRRTDATLPTHRPPTQVTAGAPLVVGGVLAGESPGAGAAPVTIGRAPDNSVVVDDLLVSRHHLRATPVREGFRIEDLGSRNGSYVNGTPITSCTLRPGDRLTVGHLEFRIEGGALKMTPTRTRVSFEAKNLRVRLPVGKQLLDDVSFALPEASLLGVIGPSGAGKSTLLGALTGGRKATSGDVLFDGRDLYDNYAELRHRIGVVPQEDVVHRQLTVRQALNYAVQLRFPADLERSARAARIAEVLAELGLDAHQDTRIDRLSGGQRKRTSVAMELLTRPSLLFLDEPTSGLDPGLDKSVMQTLRSLADGGRTVVVVTHSVANLGLCDRVLLLAPGGEVAYFGRPEGLLPFFGQENFADVFQSVAADPKGTAERFRATLPGPVSPTPRFANDGGPGHAAHHGQGPGQGQEHERGAGPAAEPRRQQPRVRQAAILGRRQVRVLVADRSYALFTALLPFVMAALVMTVPGAAGFGPPSRPPTGEATQLLVVLIVGAAFMGLAASARDLVGERPIFLRERAVGLAPSAYLWAKLAVFGGLAALQSAVLVGLVMLVKTPPDGASALGHGVLEIYLAVALTTFASAIVGLLISALVATTEQVMPLLIVTLMAQLVLCGGLIPVSGRAGLEQVAWVSPSRWGYAAAASTVDVHGKTRPQPARAPAPAPSASTPSASTPSVAPTPVPAPVVAEAPATDVDHLWDHDARTWWRNIAMLVLLGAFATAATALRLARTGRKGP